MRIGILTSSRADYGIYRPLLIKLKQEKAIQFQIIAFGTHLSQFHGYTVRNIEKDGFDVKFRIESIITSDSEEAISSSMALTSLKFASFWGEHRSAFDLVLCLGDRYEMFAAVSAGIPFNIKFAHIHAGERTISAIDNIFRHSISHASCFHFASTKEYAERLKHMLDSNSHIYNIGALGLDNIELMTFYSQKEFNDRYGIDLDKPTVLVTFHPETVKPEMNEFYANELIKTIKDLPYLQFLITMPNADTAGNLIRQSFIIELSNMNHVKMVENLGTVGYFSAMKHSIFLLGNTSSGIIEAASFGKYVINIGKRQEGRAYGLNVLHVSIDKTSMLRAIDKINETPNFTGDNIYYQSGAADKIIKVLKENNINNEQL